jgi:hypothetical protein
LGEVRSLNGRKPGGDLLKIAAATSPNWQRTGPDPSRIDVFPRGPDGKLHPIAGWRTTGPFAFRTWSDEIDWNGVGQDLTRIAEGVLDAEGVKGAWEALLDAQGPGVKKAVHRGIFGAGQDHHSFPEFMGGPAKQDLVNLAPPIHKALHRNITSALRKTGSPPVGGRTGAKKVWLNIFKQKPATRDAAIEILRRVTRDFDIERGTSITPHLERELGIGKPRKPPCLK